MSKQWAAHMRCCLIAAGCAVLSACAPMHHKVLTAEDKSRVREIDLQLLVPQETFIFSASSPNVSAALGGGLIGALIDSHVQKSRQEAMREEMEAVLDRIVDVDFREEASAALKAEIASFPLRVRNTEVTARAETKAELQKRIAKTREDAAFARLLLYYSLDAKSLTLTTRTYIQLWQDGKEEKSYGGSAIFQGNVGQAGAQEKMLESLRADNARLLREQMRQAIAQTLRMVALDMTQPANAATTGGKDKFSVQSNGQPLSLTGDRLQSEASRSTYRAAGGALVSLPQ